MSAQPASGVGGFLRRRKQRRGMEARLITIECSGDLPLEERTELLTYATVKAAQGATLERIVKWGIKDGEIQIIVSGGAADPGPLGRVCVTVEEAEGYVNVYEEPVSLDDRRDT